jgi:hypothetical protein
MRPPIALPLPGCIEVVETTVELAGRKPQLTAPHEQPRPTGVFRDRLGQLGRVEGLSRRVEIAALEQCVDQEGVSQRNLGAEPSHLSQLECGAGVGLGRGDRAPQVCDA